MRKYCVGKVALIVNCMQNNCGIPVTVFRRVKTVFDFVLAIKTSPSARSHPQIHTLYYYYFLYISKLNKNTDLLIPAVGSIYK